VLANHKITQPITQRRSHHRKISVLSFVICNGQLDANQRLIERRIQQLANNIRKDMDLLNDYGTTVI